MELSRGINIFKEDLADLIRDNVFEIDMDEAASVCRIPYMMNDALECYYTLSDCQAQGAFDMDFSKDPDGWPMSVSEIAGDPGLQTKLKFLEHKEGKKQYGLIIYQGDKNVTTLWFSGVKKEIFCYRYHEIGHFWAKGAEQWRRLTYLIGTAYDKYLFLDDDLVSMVCNEEELALLPAMEFAPFQKYSPVDMDLSERYPDTEEGAIFFENLAKRFGLTKLQKLCLEYRKLVYGKLSQISAKGVFASTLGRSMAEKQAHLSEDISLLLNDISSAPLYDYLFQSISHASALWPERNYPDEQREMMLNYRAIADKWAKEQGYEGEYPRYFKYEKTAEGITVTGELLAAEEHPFTLMDPEFSFKIRFMKSGFSPIPVKDDSESSDSQSEKGGDTISLNPSTESFGSRFQKCSLEIPVNSGFFTGSGCTHSIEEFPEPEDNSNE